MSRRKQAKPKSSRRDDSNIYDRDGEIGDQDIKSIDEMDGRSIDDAHQPIPEDQSALDEDDRESSERSTSGTPPTPSGLARHECNYCESSFGSFFLLKQHEQDNHAHLMPFKCRFCSKGFKHKRSHDRHEKSHSGIRKHKCAYCGQAFFRSDHLKLHLKTHEISKYAFVCILCQRGFHSSAGLESHMQNHEKSKRPGGDADSSISDAQSIDHQSDVQIPLDFTTNHDKVPKSIGHSQCSVCEATFKSAEHLLRHMDTDHRVLRSRPESPIVRYSQKYIPSPEIGGHRSTSLACPWCSVGDFYSDEALELHLQAVHGLNSKSKWSNPAYGCGICGQSFGEIGLLQKHTLNSHTLKDLDAVGESTAARACRNSTKISTSNDPTYECQTCGRVFDSILALHGHASSVHGSLPEHVATPVSKSPFADSEYGHCSKSSQLYQCGQCQDVVFTDLTSFSGHMRQHVQSNRQCVSKSAVVDQQFDCDLCGAKFGNESIRDQHAIKHYLEKASQYSCKSCAKVFSNPDELQKHLLDIHAVHMYRCSLCKEIFESRVDIQVHFAVGHSDEITRFRCRSCNATFQTDDQFGAHVHAVHLKRYSETRSNSTAAERMDFTGSDVLDFTSGSAGIGNGQASFCCPFCGQAFSVEYLYEKHLENTHRAQMEMFMLNEFIPKASVSQLLSQAMKLKSPFSAIDSGTANGIFTNSSSSTSTIIKCNICDRRCETMLELAEHKLQHCKVLHCQNCNFCHEPINSMAEFHSHTRQHNAGHGIPVSCIVCKQSLVSAVDMQTHAKFHLMLTTSSTSASATASKLFNFCTRCGKQIIDGTANQLCANCTTIKDDQELHTANQHSISKCRHCNVKFETLEERNQHECESHRPSNPGSSTSGGVKSKPYQCIKCQKSFATESEIQAHVTTHVLQEGLHHYCMLCKKVFDSPSKLQCHLIEHSFVGCSEMQCYLCNAIFALPQPLQQHMLSKHGVDDRPYECPYPRCDQKFFFRAELENHSFVHQPQQSSKNQSDNTESTGCPNCGISFTNATTFNSHLLVCSSSKWKSSEFNSGSTLATSSSGTGQKEKQPSNSQTRVSNGRRGDSENGEGGLHYCPHCSKSFQSLSALQGHSHVHMVSKTHQCTKCRKVFPTAAKLRNHQRQHSGDKPFPCTMCMRFFSRKDNLKVHMRIHYKQNGSSELSSPGTSTSIGSNGDFPTMVQRSSNFAASDQNRAENDEQSSDGSNAPFDFTRSMVFVNEGDFNSNDDQNSRVNED